jgi:hypothetical protein
MFLGHQGLALAAKRLAPKTSFGTLWLSTEFTDTLWPLFLLLGLEHVRIDPGNTRMTPFDFYDYPISHSLLTDVGWAAAFGIVYFALKKYRTGAIVVAFGVLSHWVLDWLSHRPDMPVLPWSTTKYGLGLWNSVWGTVLVELGLFFGGLYFYVKDTRPKDRTGTWALVSFVALMLVIWTGAVFGPPPPNMTAVKLSGVALWLAIPWAYWIDRHRTNKS